MIYFKKSKETTWVVLEPSLYHRLHYLLTTRPTYGSSFPSALSLSTVKGERRPGGEPVSAGESAALLLSVSLGASGRGRGVIRRTDLFTSS